MSFKFKKSNQKIDAARFCEADFSKEPSLTVQAPAEEVDINKIMARINKGQTVLSSNGQPFYGDVSEFGGLQEAFMKVQESEELFMQYPAEIREKFENDPIKFIEFLAEDKNHQQAVEMGLKIKRPAPELVATPVPAPAPVPESKHS